MTDTTIYAQVSAADFVKHMDAALKHYAEQMMTESSSCITGARKRLKETFFMVKRHIDSDRTYEIVKIMYATVSLLEMQLVERKQFEPGVTDEAYIFMDEIRSIYYDSEKYNKPKVVPAAPAP